MANTTSITITNIFICTQTSIITNRPLRLGSVATRTIIARSRRLITGTRWSITCHWTTNTHTIHVTRIPGRACIAIVARCPCGADRAPDSQRVATTFICISLHRDEHCLPRHQGDTGLGLLSQLGQVVIRASKHRRRVIEAHIQHRIESRTLRAELVCVIPGGRPRVGYVRSPHAGQRIRAGR